MARSTDVRSMPVSLRLTPTELDRINEVTGRIATRTVMYVWVMERLESEEAKLKAITAKAEHDLLHGDDEA